MPSRGFSIRLFVPDGTSGGLRTAEKSNWIGRGLVCPRVQFPEFKGRPEFAKTGVYVLTGPSPASELPLVYVGEGDPIRPRLESHFGKKDFWTTLTLFVSKDDNLNKAHVQYLEARLVEIARDMKRCELDNGNVPQLPSLSEPDAAEMEGYLEEMLLVFPLLGISAFEKPQEATNSIAILTLKGKGLTACGYETPQGFIVKKGSQAPIETVPSVEQHTPYVLDLRKSLLERGILSQESTCLVLQQDYVFESPSAASSVMLGRSSNGRVEWKTEDGRTLKELQISGN